MIISYAQNFEDVMLWRALKHVDDGFYIDVGANDPTVDSVTKLFYEQGWCGINIEPLRLHVDALERDRPRDINLCLAVGAAAAELDLWECDVRGWATADENVVQAHRAKGHEGRYTKVAMLPLRAVCQQHAPKDIHFLKIDVEGFERDVLQGMDFVRFRPWIVVVEATRPHSTEEVHAQWESLLVDVNYRFVYGDGLNRFYLADEHADLAAAFRYPPNFFDEFVKAPLIEDNLWAETIVARAVAAAAGEADARAQAAAAANREADAWAQAQAAQARSDVADLRIAALTSSTSWRITAPLRWLMQHLKRPVTRMIDTPLLPQINIEVDAQKLAAAPEPGTLCYLSPRVQRIYSDVKKTRDASHQVVTLPLGESRNVRPTLAYVSPLPPQRSGIADYSVELLPALAHFYAIDVIVDQPELSTPWITEHCGVRSVDWFLDHPDHYDRVVYHFGNSAFHQHMFKLLNRVRGVVVLHDFYLGDVLNYLDVSAIEPNAFARALYESHGYGALLEWSQAPNLAEVIAKYPANWRVVGAALGVIVHSEYARHLASTWFSQSAANNWTVMPLLRAPMPVVNRAHARAKLGLAENAFLVCSFGLLGPLKLNHRLLAAWLSSQLANDDRCMLVFVGEEHQGEYGKQLQGVIANSGHGHQIRITGWADMSTFVSYLDAADMAVQLRASSRGETSAAVLDCMNHALPTIVNANGAFAELPSDSVWMLPDNFGNDELVGAMESLWQSAAQCSQLGQRGQMLLQRCHAPDVYAEQCAHVIEQAYDHAKLARDSLAQALAQIERQPATDDECLAIAQVAAQEQARTTSTRQLLIDVSATCRNDLKTGIQRVVRALIWELIKKPPDGYRVEPVCLTNEGAVWHYRYAREWTAGALGITQLNLHDEPIDYSNGDVLFVADFTSAYAVEAEKHGVFATLKAAGVALYFCVYDLLPIDLPEFFPPDQFGFGDWLSALTRSADGAICISEAVADSLTSWMRLHGPSRSTRLSIDWFHLGANIENSIPTTGIPADAKQVLAKLKAAPSFLMVGTIEPRKGYLQTLQAFTELWRAGFDINLIIVGHEGWRGLPEDMRRTIPEIVRQLQLHPELGGRLLWLKGISDEYLEKIYAASTCLLAASEGEGFGLPLIEAAQNSIPILARNIPVFKEVAGRHACYFEGLEPEALVKAVVSWLQLNEMNEAPTSEGMTSLSWAQSSERIIEILGLTLLEDEDACCL